MTETIRERVLDSAVAALPIRWRRGDAQKDYEREDVAPIVDAILNILSEPGEEDVERVARDLAGRGGFSWGDLGDIPYSVFDDPQGSKRYWLKLARASIKAYVSGGEG